MLFVHMICENMNNYIIIILKLENLNYTFQTNLYTKKILP